MAYIEGGCPLIRSFISAVRKRRRPLPPCVHMSPELIEVMGKLVESKRVTRSNENWLYATLRDHECANCPYNSNSDANWVEQWTPFEGEEVGVFMVHEMVHHIEDMPEGGVSAWGEIRPTRAAMAAVRLKGKDGKWKFLRRAEKVLLDANGRWKRSRPDHLTKGIGDHDRVLAEQDLLLSGAEVLTPPKEVATDVIERWIERHLVGMEIKMEEGPVIKEQLMLFQKVMGFFAPKVVISEVTPGATFSCWGEETRYTLEDRPELIPAFMNRMKPKRFKKVREANGEVHTDPQFSFAPHIRTKAGFRGFCPSYLPAWDGERVVLRPGKWGYFYSYKYGR